MWRLHRFGYVLLGELATTRFFYTLHRAIYRLLGGRILAARWDTQSFSSLQLGGRAVSREPLRFSGSEKENPLLWFRPMLGRSTTPRGISTFVPTLRQKSNWDGNMAGKGTGGDL